MQCSPQMIFPLTATLSASPFSIKPDLISPLICFSLFPSFLICFPSFFALILPLPLFSFIFPLYLFISPFSVSPLFSIAFAFITFPLFWFSYCLFFLFIYTLLRFLIFSSFLAFIFLLLLLLSPCPGFSLPVSCSHSFILSALFPYFPFTFLEISHCSSLWISFC